MQTSGPIRKDVNFHHVNDYGDIIPVKDNIYLTTCDGKRLFLKTAKNNTTQAAVLLRREFDISCNLQHPYILTPLRYEEATPVGAAIVMEFVEGCTLSQFIAKEQSKNMLGRLFFEILDAVDYLHKKGLLHNDLKADNIMVSTIGNHIKIIDFGLSETDAEYLTRRLGGTIEASAPEVLSGNVDLPSTASSDVYSLGYIMRIMFPGQYSSIVRKCLQEDSSLRYADVTSLKQAIRRAELRRKLLMFIPFIVAVIAIIVSLAYSYNQKLISETELWGQKIDSIQRARTQEVEMLKETVARLQEDSLVVEKIKNDIEKMYLATKDTLENPTYSPYFDFAMPYLINWNSSIDRYKKKYDDKYHSAIRTYYDKYNQIVYDITVAKMPLYKAESDGLISEEAADYYRSLIRAEKPFSPFKSSSHK